MHTNSTPICSRRRRLPVIAAAVLAPLALPHPAPAQLRLAQWNITAYSSGRVADFQTAIFSSFSGRSMSPDAIITEEVVSQAGADNFLALLNSAPSVPHDWALAQF